MNSGTNLCDLCATGGESDVLGQDVDKVINLILRRVTSTVTVCSSFASNGGRGLAKEGAELVPNLKSGVKSLEALPCLQKTSLQ